VGQPRGVPAGKSCDIGDREAGTAAIGVPGMGVGALDPEACLPFAMNVNLASISQPKE